MRTDQVRLGRFCEMGGGGTCRYLFHGCDGGISETNYNVNRAGLMMVLLKSKIACRLFYGVYGDITKKVAIPHLHHECNS